MKKRGKREWKDKIVFVLIALVLASISLSLYSISLISLRKEEVNLNPFSLPQLSTLGFLKIEEVEARVVDRIGIITLKAKCYEITANTEFTQAESIEKGIKKIIRPRPTTHDIMKEIFEDLGIKLLMVKVVDIRENTFIGEMIIQKDNRIISIDSRPSDGIALAVRLNSPIYFKEELLEKYGRKIC